MKFKITSLLLTLVFSSLAFAGFDQDSFQKILDDAREQYQTLSNRDSGLADTWLNRTLLTRNDPTLRELPPL